MYRTASNKRLALIVDREPNFTRNICGKKQKPFEAYINISRRYVTVMCPFFAI